MATILTPDQQKKANDDLLEAAYTGTIEDLSTALAAGAEVSARDAEQNTATNIGSM